MYYEMDQRRIEYDMAEGVVEYGVVGRWGVWKTGGVELGTR